MPRAAAWTRATPPIGPGGPPTVEQVQTGATLSSVTQLDLRTLRIRSGEQFRDTRQVHVDPLTLAGQRYAAVPREPEADVVVTRTRSGFVLELSLDARLHGPCFRCLDDTALTLPLRGREYHSSDAPEADELRSQYVSDDRLDLSAWARDLLALALPDKILCRDECAGLCPVCGKNLNAEPHEHAEAGDDPRWEALAELRERL